MMALMQEFLLTACLRHFLKGGMNCFLQMVVKTVLMDVSSGQKVSQKTVLMVVMPNRMKQPEICGLNYLMMTFVQILNGKNPKKYGMRHFLTVQIHQTESLAMPNLSAERLISFSLIP